MRTQTSRTAPFAASIAPWLSVDDAAEAVNFYRAAFGAVALYRLEDDAGNLTAVQLSIDGADFWVQQDPAASPESVAGLSVRIILTVDDPNAVFAQAIAAGATEVAPVSEEHGWRMGRIVDPAGHHWEIGKRLKG